MNSVIRSVLIVLPFTLIGGATLLLTSRQPARPGVIAAVSPPTSTMAGTKELGAMTQDDEIDAILDDDGPADEADSKLWADLHRWAFSEDRDIPARDEMTAAQAEQLLDEAAAAVEGLTTGR